MKKTLLLQLVLICGILSAQDPYRNLIITEASLGYGPMAYVELTNKGSETINLSDFELGKVTPSTSRTGYIPGQPMPPLENWFSVPEFHRMKLPDVELAPGQSWVVANVSDWRRKMELTDPFTYRERLSQPDMYEISGYHMHYPETQVSSTVRDSIDPNYQVLDITGGSDCIYIRHHYINSSGQNVSVVIDQVGGIFDDVDGTNRDQAYSVAGISNATNTHHLLRKADVTVGNIDFNQGRGVDSEDSEWMPMRRYTARHPVQWHTGNHGPFVLDENTLQPKPGSGVTVDWDNSVINIPWGVQRDDSLVYRFERTPGMGWEYRYVSEHADSAYLSARTADTLRVYIAGNTLQWIDFHIEVAAPATDASIVVPKKAPDHKTGWFGKESAYIDNAYIRVTGGNQVDTIKHSYNIPGITFATRVDTLFKYLEKAPQASWEIVWVDGMERADLKHGDMLRVTAESGAVKDYFIRVGEYRPGNNANLGAITWPDIPGMYRGMFGWQGDTIPNFSPTIYNYSIMIPSDVEGLPALVARPQHPNARVEVGRAKSYTGAIEDRTVTFTVTSESDTIVRVYTVTLEKEQMPHHIQPYRAEPIISEFIFWEQWNNGYVEIANTGTLPIDLSNYLFANRYSEGPESVFQEPLAHHNRYQLYIPGYRWTSSLSGWELQPLMPEADINIYPILNPGDVFVMGDIRSWNFAREYENSNNTQWWVPGVLDIDFGHRTVDGERMPGNPWGEHIVNPATNTWGESVARQWNDADFYIFKILNDSIKMGLKPATDPNDFEVIEIFGTGDLTPYNADHHSSGSTQMITSMVRKPEYVLPNPEPKGSFGETIGESEWTYIDEQYWMAQQVGWPQQILYVALGLGSHDFIAPTHYKSTVTSNNYLVSPGYTDEQIRGIVTGTSADQFLALINKMDPGQTLSVISAGDTIQGNDIITDGDVLSVLSADRENITNYALVVKHEGLSSNAILTSDQFIIEVNGTSGTISGFDNETFVRAVLNGITVPAGATLDIIDDEDRYVALQNLYFDHYVDTRVSDLIWFELTAEDGETKILYRLLPDSTPDDAYVFSDVYWVDQTRHLINYVPEEISVAGLLGNLTSSAGATVRVVDKNMMDRQQGTLMKDDRIHVVSQNGSSSRIYFINISGDNSQYAWLASPVYEVDQFIKKVTVKREEGDPVLYYELLDGIRVSPHATLKVTDEHSQEKSGSDTVESGDIMVVTSGDGLTVSSYTTDVLYLPAWSLTYAPSQNGSILGDGNQRVLHGSHGTAVSAMPDYGYHFAGWSDGENTNPRSDLYVTEDIQVEALFEINTYTLTYSSGDNGSIEGSSVQSVTHGSNGTQVEAIPDTGYRFVRWSDGITHNPRTDENVTGSLVVQAGFAATTYTLTYSAGQNGSITGDAIQEVELGSGGTLVEAVPDTGYHFVQWSDGITDNPRTDQNVTETLDVQAEFAVNTYTLAYSAGQNGSITGDEIQVVVHGSGGTAIEAVPAPGYHFVQWSDGSTMNPRTDETITENIAIEAEFGINIHNISATEYPSASGTISGQDEYEHGETITLSAVPSEGYLFEKWTENGSDFTGSLENPLVFPAEEDRVLVANFIVDETTGIDPAGKQGMVIWPNPADDVIYIEGLTGRTTVYIHDLNGSLVAAREPVNNQIKIDDLPPGIYILKFITENQATIHRLIKQ